MSLQPAPTSPLPLTEAPAAATNGPALASPSLLPGFSTQSGFPSGPPGSSRLPRPRRWSKSRKIVVFATLGLVAAGTVTAAALWWTGLFAKDSFNGPTAPVVRKVLQITIVERGELASAKNSDITCTVRARTQGSTTATTIKWLLGNGTEVKKGDKVIELDDSGLQEQLKDQRIKVDTAKAEWIKADEQYNIDDIQTATDVKKAENDKVLADTDLEKYREGEYVQKQKDILGRIETAKSDYEQWKDRAAWSRRMVKKGFISQSQADADASREDGARLALEKVKEEERVLENKKWGDRERTIKDLSFKVSQAIENLKKFKLQRRATLAADEVIRLSKKSTYEQELAKKRDLETEITKCILLAPQDGIVVYYIPEQTRFGAGTQQSLPAQGEPVREGQKLMQIPDLSQMLVKVSVQEAKVSYLHNEDPDDKSRWQQALIRVDAYSDRILHGHVQSIENTASALDFFASDVALYKTLVPIDESLEGLKPGMKAEVTIVANKSPTPVLVIPIQSVVGTISGGASRQCFVLGRGGRPELRDIVVGMSNEREVEVNAWDEQKRSGVKEGEEVVLNPRPLLPEDTELRPAKARNRKTENGDGDGGNGGEKKNWKKKDNGSGPKGPGGPGGSWNSTGKGPGTAEGGKAPGGFDPAAMQRKAEQFFSELRNLTPAQRRDRINALPEAFREQTRQGVRAKGMEVAD
jgi:multidrug efflux pump subunit AcrA (membrane-fusion protein)